MSERSERISGHSGLSAPGTSPDPFPGDTHWYDLPDDDAAQEEDGGGVFTWLGRGLRRR